MNQSPTIPYRITGAVTAPFILSVTSSQSRTLFAHTTTYALHEASKQLKHDARCFISYRHVRTYRHTSFVAYLYLEGLLSVRRRTWTRADNVVPLV